MPTAPVVASSAQVAALRARLEELGKDAATLALTFDRAGLRRPYVRMHDAINRMRLAMNRLVDAERALQEIQEERP